jgi:hypothetical protein
MFLAWYDPDRKRKPTLKFTDAIERYVEKFGEQPSVCLTTAELASEIASEAAGRAIEVLSKPYLPKNTFYVGHWDEPEDMLAAA